MKKQRYNKSQIMKNAWKLVKDSHKWCKEFWITLSEALKREWAKAKKTVAAEEKLQAMGNYFYGSIGTARVHFNINEGIVSGNTYRCKETLKQYGLRFNGTEKYWEGTCDQVRELALDYME